MPWGAVAAVGGNLLGGILGGNSARKAAETSANAQVKAARIAAEASKFRPVGMTTNFGSSNFVVDKDGNLVSAEYVLDPRLQNLQTGLMSGYANQLYNAQNLDVSPLMTGGQNLFSLGQQYLATSPEQASQDWLANQRALLAPLQEQELAGVRNKLYRTGRTGLATGGTSAGSMAQTNPELAAYYNSLAATDRDLAAKADLYGQQRTQFGQGLLTGGADVMGKGFGLQSSAYGPLTTALGVSGAVEEQGMLPFTLGTNLGGKTTQANQYGANLLNTASQNAALTRQAANQYNPYAAAITGAANSPYLSNWFNQQITPQTQTYSNTNLMYDQYGMNPQYAPNASYNPNWFGGTGGMGD